MPSAATRSRHLPNGSGPKCSLSFAWHRSGTARTTLHKSEGAVQSITTIAANSCAWIARVAPFTLGRCSRLISYIVAAFLAPSSTVGLVAFLFRSVWVYWILWT
jgi:hypothetical protein